nr:MAG TPA: hypothetical protein [Caudoviricetes sp.]
MLENFKSQTGYALILLYINKFVHKYYNDGGQK